LKKEEVNRHFQIPYEINGKKRKNLNSGGNGLSPTKLLLRDPKLSYFTHSPHEILKIKYKLKREV